MKKCKKCGYIELSKYQKRIMELLDKNPMTSNLLSNDMLISHPLTIYHLNELLKIGYVRIRLNEKYDKEYYSNI